MKKTPLFDSSKQYFDVIGAQWDRLRESFFSESVRDKALDAAAVRKGRVAADLGAGTGFITHGLLARAVRVIAVDQSEKMLEALSQNFPCLDRVECRVGNAENLPIDDRSVDYCLANMYLHHTERPLVAIKEMVRILKPGGRAVVTDLDTHWFEFLRDEHHDRWLGFKRWDVSNWFREAGFTNVRVESSGDECCTTSNRSEKAAISIFIAVGTKPEGA